MDLMSMLGGMGGGEQPQQPSPQQEQAPEKDDSLDNKFIKKSQFEKLLDFIKDLAKTNKEYENILNKHGLRIA